MNTVFETHKGVYQFSGFGRNIVAAFSGRQYTAANRGEFLSELGFHDETLIRLKQEHTDTVAILKGNHPGVVHEPADAALTDRRDMILSVLTADCIPVFLAAGEGVVGIIHAGWRGLKKGIVKKTVQTALEQWGVSVSEIKIAFGPAIRKCCYNVSEEFEGYFPGYYFSLSKDERAGDALARGSLDLVGIAYSQLAAAGVAKAQVDDCGICTSCSNDRFYSVRRENKTSERILSVIALKRE